MKTSLFLLKMALSLVPSSLVWLCNADSFNCYIRMYFDKETIRYLLSIGGIYERKGGSVWIYFKNVRYSFDLFK
jgi:hypothetical protein